MDRSRLASHPIALHTCLVILASALLFAQCTRSDSYAAAGDGIIQSGIEGQLDEVTSVAAVPLDRPPVVSSRSHRRNPRWGSLAGVLAVAGLALAGTRVAPRSRRRIYGTLSVAMLAVAPFTLDWRAFADGLDDGIYTSEVGLLCRDGACNAGDAIVISQFVGTPVMETGGFIDQFDRERRLRGDCLVDKGDNCVTDDDVIDTFKALEKVGPPVTPPWFTPGSSSPLVASGGPGGLGFITVSGGGGGFPILYWDDGDGGGGSSGGPGTPPGGGPGGGDNPEPPGPPVPEPSAFLVFALGLLGVKSRARRAS